MIKLINCFKMEPELDKVSSEEWAEAGATGKIELGYLKSRINLQDEGALELSLRFRDAAKKAELECSLAAVSAGNKTAVVTLQTLAALGFTTTDRVVWGEEFSPLRTARVLTDVILAGEKPDVIVCGGQTASGSNRAVPLHIADIMNVPCVTGVTDFKPVDERSIRVTYKRDGLVISETVDMPLVLAIGDVQQAYLRVPTLMDRMATMAQPVGEITPECEESGDAQLRGFRYLDLSRDGQLVDGSDASAAAEQIMNVLRQEGVVK